MTLYRIKAWDVAFENHETKKIKGRLPWVRLVTRRDGRIYKRLVDARRHRNAVAHYGVFVALLGIAGTCEPRGTLIDDCGKPLTLDDLADMTSIDVGTVREAVERLASQEIGWLTVENLPASPGIARDATDRGEETRSEEKRTHHTAGAGAEAHGSIPEGEPRTRSGFPEAPRFYAPPSGPLPMGFEPDAPGRAYATAKGLDPDAVRDRLRNAAEARNWMRSDWQAAYREHVDRLAEWAQRDGASPRAAQRTSRATPEAATSAAPKAGTRPAPNDLKAALRGGRKP